MILCKKNPFLLDSMTKEEYEYFSSHNSIYYRKISRKFNFQSKKICLNDNFQQHNPGSVM